MPTPATASTVRSLVRQDADIREPPGDRSHDAHRRPPPHGCRTRSARIDASGRAQRNGGCRSPGAAASTRAAFGHHRCARRPAPRGVPGPRRTRIGRLRVCSPHAPRRPRAAPTRARAGGTEHQNARPSEAPRGRSAMVRAVQNPRPMSAAIAAAQAKTSAVVRAAPRPPPNRPITSSNHFPTRSCSRSRHLLAALCWNSLCARIAASAVLACTRACARATSPADSTSSPMLVSLRTSVERVAGQVPGVAGAAVRVAISHSALTAMRSSPSTTLHVFGSLAAMAGAPAAPSSAAISALSERMPDRNWMRGRPSIEPVSAVCAAETRLSPRKGRSGVRSRSRTARRETGVRVPVCGGCVATTVRSCPPYWP